ncbi:M20 family metallopeptidase [Vacuolonema iberomarrocanum]|uniref:M20 family metallopeptidase n=1 Tax=Vacuolonema iberomarrocanum TaxID=3454632 RepID=UPI001A0D9F8B|nr:M20 family metallopeptidase [filamentous cyanobacterium LEGE 07170]
MTTLQLPSISNGQLLDYLHRRRDDMQTLLETLVQIETPSTVPTSQVPILERLRWELRQRQFRVRSLPGRKTGGHLFAIATHRRSCQSAQLLIGHCDTVWPLGTLAQMPLKVSQGKLYGPGSYDMKAGLVILLFAVEAILALQGELAIAPMVLINSDEEIGSGESTRYIRHLAQVCDRALVFEPSLGPRGHLKTARKGVGRFTVTVLGQAAHAGLDPGKGASAILELSHVIQTLFALNDPDRGITVNVGTIDGGIRPNVVAPESRAIVDVRVLHQADVPQLEAAIRGLQAITPGTRLEISGRIGRPPMEKTPGNQQLWHLAQAAATELGIELDQETVGGGSDGNTTSLYTPTLDGLGAVGDAAHSPGEFVYLDSLIERTALVSKLLLAQPLSLSLASKENSGKDVTF